MITLKAIGANAAGCRRVGRPALVLALACGLSVISSVASVGASEGTMLAVSFPAVCSDATTSAATPQPVPSSMITTGGQTFGLTFTPDSRGVFVSTDNPPSLRLYSLAAGVPVPTGPNWWTSSLLGADLALSQPSGLALTKNGRDLLVATANGAVVFEVSGPTVNDTSLKFLGELASPRIEPLEIALSPDDGFAFLSDHVGNGALEVFNLQHALTDGFGRADLVGVVPLGTVLPGGMTLSPNGRYLYVVSERRSTSQSFGTLTTLDVRTLEKTPSRAVVSTVDSGCGSVRVTATTSSVYVSARDADSLLAFSANALVEDPNHALRSTFQVGAGPIGLEVADHAKVLVVADSRGGGGGGGYLVTFRIGRNGEPVLVSEAKSGNYPREMARSPDGKWIAVGDWESDQLQVIRVDALLPARLDH
jgi:DNA-binding beta-propeller fold protein YncE